MNHKDLIKLAYTADIDGDMELADYLDNQLIRVADMSKVKDYLKGKFIQHRQPHYNVDFSGLQPDAGNLNMMTAHPTQKGNAFQKLFQAGLKDKVRTPERLGQIDQVIKESLDKVISSDPNVYKAISKFKAGKHGEISPAERNALLNHLVNVDKISTRANDIMPDDILKVLSGKKPDVATKQVTTLSKFGKGLGYGAGAAAAGTVALTGMNAYNAAQKNQGYQPGSNFSDPNATGSPFGAMPEMSGGTGGGMPSMGEMPEMGGSGGGYQGPTYQMPSAQESFQPMQGYRPANQIEQLPQYNDQAAPLYPRINSQQAMQNAMVEDQARRYRELMAQGNQPTAEPIVGPGNQEIYGPTQGMVNPGGVSYNQAPSQTEYLPAPPSTEGTNDPNANVIYTPETSPRTDNYQLT